MKFIGALTRQATKVTVLHEVAVCFRRRTLADVPNGRVIEVYGR